MNKCIVIALPVLSLALCLLAGCRNSGTPAPPTATSVPTSNPPPVTTAPPTPPALSKTPVKDAVEKLLAQQATQAHPLFPVGTRLLSAKLEDGVVTLDFSKEFDGLANMGDSVEGAAQKALADALVPIPNVEKLRVTVEGRAFDSQMADWSTPFPVRESTASAHGGEEGAQ